MREKTSFPRMIPLLKVRVWRVSFYGRCWCGGGARLKFRPRPGSAVKDSGGGRVTPVSVIRLPKRRRALMREEKNLSLQMGRAPHDRNASDDGTCRRAETPPWD